MMTYTQTKQLCDYLNDEFVCLRFECEYEDVISILCSKKGITYVPFIHDGDADSSSNESGVREIGTVHLFDKSFYLTDFKVDFKVVSVLNKIIEKIESYKNGPSK